MNKIITTLLYVFIGTFSISLAVTTAPVSNVTFDFTKDVYAVTEGVRAVVTVKPDRAVEENTSLTVEVKGGTATKGIDYVLPGANGVFKIPYLKGEKGEKNFTVSILKDSVTEIKDETIMVSIKSISVNGVVINTPVVTTAISIKDAKSANQPSKINIEVDKTSSAYTELFKITLTGLPANYFTDGDILRLRRQSAGTATVAQCLGAIGGPNCQRGEEIICGVLPKYMDGNSSRYIADSRGKLEYICHVDDVRSTRGTASTPEVYTISVSAPSPIPYTNGAVTPRMTATNAPTITIGKKGIAPTNLTNYGSLSDGTCAEGKGLNPDRVFAGCEECQNLREEFFSGYSTCQNVKPTLYTWAPEYTFTDRDAWYYYPRCNGNPGAANTSCSKNTMACRSGGGPNGTNTKEGMYLHRCVGDRGYEYGISGKVVGTDGKAISGVGVTAPQIGYGGGSLATTTNDEGKYLLKTSIDALSPYLVFKKDGYVSGAVIGVNGSNETVTLRKVVITQEQEVCPVDSVFSTTILVCKCPNGTTRESVAGSGAKCVSPVVNNISLNMVPSEGTFEPSKTEIITFTLHDAQYGDLEACYAVISHPGSATSESPDYCFKNGAYVNEHFTSFNGNDDWKFNDAKNKLIGTFKYSTGTWGKNGIVTKAYFRKKSFRSDVETATINVYIPKPKAEAATRGATGTTGTEDISCVDSSNSGKVCKSGILMGTCINKECRVSTGGAGGAGVSGGSNGNTGYGNDGLGGGTGYGTGRLELPPQPTKDNCELVGDCDFGSRFGNFGEDVYRSIGSFIGSFIR